MFNSKQGVSHHLYLDSVKNYKRMMLLSNFVLSSDLEEDYVEYLQHEAKKEFDTNEFADVINEEIEQYEITDEQINKFLSIKIPAS